MTNFINLTPHAINIIQSDGNNLEIPASGTVARVAVQQAQVSSVGSIPVMAATYGNAEGLPAPADNTIYIVSGLVRSAFGNLRPDVVAPNTNDAVRNEQGHIQGVRSFVGVPLGF